MPRYSPAAIEPKWQHYWETNRTFATPRLPKGPKIYVLDMFPYPSGAGLHVGHPEGYTATDIVCRYRRNRGYSVMHPMGWDAFGLPAEQHAKKTGTHPRTTTESNINTFRRQLKMLGFSYDWDRELATTDVAYFRWTQFIFLVLFDTWFDARAAEGPADRRAADPRRSGRAGARGRRPLSRRAAAGLSDRGPGQLVPGLGHGAGQRGGDRRPERTRRPSRGPHAAAAMDAADHRLRRSARKGPRRARLVREHQDAAAELDRAEHGAEVDFFIGTTVDAEGKPSQQEYEGWRRDRERVGYPSKPDEQVLRIYTTRPDTLFGATYMVIAPEHPFVERLTMPEQAEAVRAYCEKAARKSDLDRNRLQTESRSEQNTYCNSPRMVWMPPARWMSCKW